MNALSRLLLGVFCYAVLLIVRCLKVILNIEYYHWRNCAMIQKELGLALKQLREEKGIALSIGMDRTYYASVEAGKRNVSLQNIKKIAAGFDMPISALFVVVEKEKEV